MLLQEKASEETKAAAEPEAEAETAAEPAKDGSQDADAGQQQISAGPSPAVSGSTPTKPTDAPATSSKQGKGKAKVRHLYGETGMHHRQDWPCRPRDIVPAQSLQLCFAERLGST